MHSAERIYPFPTGNVGAVINRPLADSICHLSYRGAIIRSLLVRGDKWGQKKSLRCMVSRAGRQMARKIKVRPSRTRVVAGYSVQKAKRATP